MTREHFDRRMSEVPATIISKSSKCNLSSNEKLASAPRKRSPTEKEGRKEGRKEGNLDLSSPPVLNYANPLASRVKLVELTLLGSENIERHKTSAEPSVDARGFVLDKQPTRRRLSHTAGC